jgi:hypothetical protein
MSAKSTSPNRPQPIPLEAVPIVCEGITLENLVLDQREGFLLSRLDGDRKSTRLNSSHVP